MKNNFYVLDIGGSTIDCIRFENGEYFHVFTLSSDLVKDKDPSTWFFDMSYFQQTIQDGYFVLTGGKSSFFPEYYIYGSQRIFVYKIHEFCAIAKGAAMLSGVSNGLAVSVGTGTAMVQFDNDSWIHVKGIGIGGGTLLGLSKALFQKDFSFFELEQLAKKGNSKNINITVKDIVGGDIGLLKEDATASNFAKYSFETSKEDIAMGIVTMVSEVIVALAMEKSMRFGNIPIIVGGKGAKLSLLQEKMKESAEIFGISISIPKDAGFITSVGAGGVFISQN